MAFGSREKRESEREAKDAARRAAQAAEEQRIAEQKAQRLAAIDKFQSDFRDDVQRAVELLGAAHLYLEIYVPVDAQMDDFGPPVGLDLSFVNEYSRRGWDIVSVVPRTYGGFRSYKVSKTNAYGLSGWGKDTHQVGLGGHIVGVYMIVHLEVNQGNLAASEEIIREVARRNLPEALAEPSP